MVHSLLLGGSNPIYSKVQYLLFNLILNFINASRTPDVSVMCGAKVVPGRASKTQKDLSVPMVAVVVRNHLQPWPNRRTAGVLTLALR